MEMKAWTVVVNRGDEGTGTSAPPGQARRIVVTTTDGRPRIIVDGRMRTHKEIEGVFHFSIGLFGCTLERDRDDEWVLAIGGRIVDAGNTLTPPALDVARARDARLPRIAISRRLVFLVAMVLLSTVGWTLRARLSATQAEWAPLSLCE